MSAAPTREAVLRIVADVLRVPVVATGDSFYDFGGTSLQAMRICAQIARQLGTQVRPEELFESETMGGFASGVAR